MHFCSNIGNMVASESSLTNKMQNTSDPSVCQGHTRNRIVIQDINIIKYS